MSLLSCLVLIILVRECGCFANWRRADGSVTLSFHWALLLWTAAPFPSPNVRELGVISHDFHCTRCPVTGTFEPLLVWSSVDCAASIVFPKAFRVCVFSLVKHTLYTVQLTQSYRCNCMDRLKKFS